MGNRKSWVDEVMRVLGEAPLSAEELAGRVGALHGHVRGDSAAIASVLGPDPRFRLGPEGRWRLEHKLLAAGSSLRFLDYAVVDVETTGGAYEAGHRIIELAVVEVREGVVTGEFNSLVDPERHIPPSVLRLTGITEAMVAGAPRFQHIADEVRERLRHRVFVAHNAAHDWAFVSGQLREVLGKAPDAVCVCTELLSRRLLASQKRHHLDALCSRFGVRVHGRHRALGDARAAARILIPLIEEADRRGIRDLESLGRVLG